ncbi:pseudouridylate synthase RPUSD4, mitochondrial-like [Macrosteles quadrilineatus]|uniref:pseudouridylate synthase RPUSD4, mitochondrial-like n=1 Tax=Macrosteles quadrilineatus TaxID=74068 RepID=UPI0023E2E438|nr:pseudouridylate synthase RPUSD4, mitochondrial-like [Macrosteles quadrilineatus]
MSFPFKLMGCQLNPLKTAKYSFILGLFTAGPKSSRNVHQYRNLVPWKNAIELSQHLIGTVIYNDNGFLVFNKPYGVSFSRSGNAAEIQKEKNMKPEEKVFKKPNKQSKDFINNQYYTSGIVSDSLSLVDCLPYIKNHFGYKKLYISRVPGKYVSGVAILTTNPELVDKVNVVHAHAPTGKDKYTAVVVGVPRHSSGVVRLGLKLEFKENIGKKPVILQEFSNNAVKDGKIRMGTFHHETLQHGFNNLTSLVKICVDLRAYNALRVFAADHLLAPVLGDNLYGGRVQTLMGIATSTHHFSEAALRPQVLPEEVYSMLQVDRSNAGIIPVHVHLSEMVLPKMLRGKPLHLSASLPPHFEWTCHKLGLTQEQEAISAV